MQKNREKFLAGRPFWQEHSKRHFLKFLQKQPQTERIVVVQTQLQSQLLSPGL